MKFFDFWYEKLMMRLSFVIAFIAFIGVFVYAYMTELMIKLPEDNTAPFVGTLVEGGQQKPLSDRVLSLDKPHRTNKELQNWMTIMVSETLTLDRQNFNAIVSATKPYFTSYGFEQYRDYLKSSQIISGITNDDYRVGAFVEGKPLLLNSSNVEGAYRWLYQVPVTISFLPNDGYSEQEAVNRKAMLRIQIRRVKLGDDSNAIQVESWDAVPRR